MVSSVLAHFLLSKRQIAAFCSPSWKEGSTKLVRVLWVLKEIHSTPKNTTAAHIQGYVVGCEL